MNRPKKKEVCCFAFCNLFAAFKESFFSESVYLTVSKMANVGRHSERLLSTPNFEA